MGIKLEEKVSFSIFLSVFSTPLNRGSGSESMSSASSAINLGTDAFCVSSSPFSHLRLLLLHAARSGSQYSGELMSLSHHMTVHYDVNVYDDAQ